MAVDQHTKWISVVKPALVTPLVLDSPHSGTIYPDDFNFIVPKLWLQQTEDCYVDELFAYAPQHGATLVKANFTRSYIDVNRAFDDLDPGIVSGVLPYALEPSDRTYAGYGLIRHLCRGQAVYAGKLSAQDVSQRVRTCYEPYHAQLKQLFDDLRGKFGAVWHLNCHSMPSHAAGVVRPDFILGDRDGTSADAEFIDMLTNAIRKLGYSVIHNDPYKGVEILKRYGHPRANMHSVQIEINRALYMNEETLEPNAHFCQLQHDLSRFVKDVAVWISASRQSEKLAAE